MAWILPNGHMYGKIVPLVVLGLPGGHLLVDKLSFTLLRPRRFLWWDFTASDPDRRTCIPSADLWQKLSVNSLSLCLLAWQEGLPPSLLYQEITSLSVGFLHWQLSSGCIWSQKESNVIFLEHGARTRAHRSTVWESSAGLSQRWAFSLFYSKQIKRSGSCSDYNGVIISHFFRLIFISSLQMCVSSTLVRNVQPEPLLRGLLSLFCRTLLCVTKALSIYFFQRCPSTHKTASVLQVCSVMGWPAGEDPL